jgi:DNA-binding transcriptional LysR family regulator
VRLTVAGKNFFGEARDILRRTAEAVKKARAGLASQAEINVGHRFSVVNAKCRTCPSIFGIT